MKKLFALAVAISMMSGLYGLSLGLGVAYENIAGPEDTDPYLAVKGDVTLPVIPIIDWRLGLLSLELPTDAKLFTLATGISSDLLIKIPMPAAFQPYLVIGLGVGYYSIEVLDETFNTTFLDFKGGIGGEMGFGGLSAYLEGGVNFGYFKFGDADAETENPLFVQAGVKFPVGL